MKQFFTAIVAFGVLTTFLEMSAATTLEYLSPQEYVQNAAFVGRVRIETERSLPCNPKNASCPYVYSASVEEKLKGPDATKIVFYSGKRIEPEDGRQVLIVATPRLVPWCPEEWTAKTSPLGVCVDAGEYNVYSHPEMFNLIVAATDGSNEFWVRFRESGGWFNTFETVPADKIADNVHRNKAAPAADEEIRWTYLRTLIQGWLKN